VFCGSFLTVKGVGFCVLVNSGLVIADCVYFAVVQQVFFGVGNYV